MHVPVIVKKNARNVVAFVRRNHFSTAPPQVNGEDKIAIAVVKNTKKSPSFGSMFKKGALGLVGLSLGFGLYEYTFNPRARRSMDFNITAFPPLLVYRWTDWKTKKFNYSPEERSAEFEALHEKYQHLPADLFKKLGGFYCKFGQIISGLDESVVPPQYVKHLKIMQDSLPYQSIEVVKEILRQDLGCDPAEVFSSFDSIPLGAASIGQVHRATLRDGSVVAVKVMYPSSEKNFRGDISTVKFFCELAQPEQLPLLDEIEKQFISEFDYRNEAKNLREVNKNLEQYRNEVVVPLPLDKDHPICKRLGFNEGLVSKNVLVMEYLEGKSLERTNDAILKELAKEKGITVEELKALHKKAANEEKQKENASKPPSESMLRAYRGFIYTRDVIRNMFSFSYNYTFGLILGKPMKYEWSTLPLDTPRILRTLFHVHGHELFVDGCFQGDPHPGNIMLLKDGRIGLVDYGQVKRIDLDTRIKVAQLYIALAEDNFDHILRAAINLGFRTKYMKPDIIVDNTIFSFDRMTPDIIDKYGNLPTFQENIEAADPVSKLAEEVVMVFRMNFLLRINAMGLGYADGEFSRVSKLWKSQAIELLKAHNAPLEPPPIPADIKLSEPHFKTR